MLEKTEGVIKKGQSRETGSIWYTRRRQSRETGSIEDEERQNTTQYVLDTTMRKQTQIM